MRFIGVVLAITSISLAIYGIQIMYDNSYSNRVVGGDAYNYIIYAARGTAFVCAGVISSVLALCCFVLSSSINNSDSHNFDESMKSHPAVDEALKQWNDKKVVDSVSGLKADKRDTSFKSDNASGWWQFIVILAIIAAVIAWLSF